MAHNEVYRLGQYVPAPVPDKAVAGATDGGPLDLRVNSGVALRIGSLNVVTVTRKGEDNYAQNASVDLAHVTMQPVTITGGPATFGTKVYITTATGKLSTASAGGTFFGWIIEDSPIPNGTDVLVAVKTGQSDA